MSNIISGKYPDSWKKPFGINPDTCGKTLVVATIDVVRTGALAAFGVKYLTNEQLTSTVLNVAAVYIAPQTAQLAIDAVGTAAVAAEVASLVTATYYSFRKKPAPSIEETTDALANTNLREEEPKNGGAQEGGGLQSLGDNVDPAALGTEGDLHSDLREESEERPKNGGAQEEGGLQTLGDNVDPAVLGTQDGTPSNPLAVRAEEDSHSDSDPLATGSSGQTSSVSSDHESETTTPLKGKAEEKIDEKPADPPKEEELEAREKTPPKETASPVKEAKESPTTLSALVLHLRSEEADSFLALANGDVFQYEDVTYKILAQTTTTYKREHETSIAFTSLRLTVVKGLTKKMFKLEKVE